MTIYVLRLRASTIETNDNIFLSDLTNHSFGIQRLKLLSLSASHGARKFVNNVLIGTGPTILYLMLRVVDRLQSNLIASSLVG